MQNIFTIEALPSGDYRMLINGRWTKPQSLESCAVDMRLEERMRTERARWVTRPAPAALSLEDLGL